MAIMILKYLEEILRYFSVVCTVHGHGNEKCIMCTYIDALQACLDKLFNFRLQYDGWIAFRY